MVSAYLVIEDLKLVIKHYSMHISKHIDPRNNYPSGKGQLRGLEIELEAPKNNFLWEQAIANYSMTPLMVIEILPAVIGNKKTRYIKLYDCHVVKHKANYNHRSNEPFTETIKLTCGGIEDSWYPATVYEEHWRVTYPNQEEAVAEEDETEGVIKEIYYEDNQGNRISKIRKNKEVFLVVKTENFTGETIDIDLSDDKYNFEYQGNILENDQLLNYSVVNDISRIPLKTIKQN